MAALRLIVLAVVLCSTLVSSAPHHNYIEKTVPVFVPAGDQGESSASSSASAGSVVGGRITKPAVTPETYNDIFNIPISVLNAVNQLLGGGGGGGGTHAGGKTKSVIETRAGDETLTSSSASASASSYSGGGGGGGTRGSNEGGAFFDRVFNIPISALAAVNKLLVNKNQK